MITLLATWTATKSEAIWNSSATRSRLNIGRSAAKSGMFDEEATNPPSPYEGSKAIIPGFDYDKESSISEALGGEGFQLLSLAGLSGY